MQSTPQGYLPEHAEKRVLGPMPSLEQDHKALEFDKYYCI